MRYLTVVLVLAASLNAQTELSDKTFRGNVAIGTTVLPASLPRSVLAYGAVGDGVVFTDGAMTSGSATFTSAASAFSSADVGKLIQVYAAGGTPQISASTWYGAGQSDVTAGGTYTGTINLGYCVKILAGGASFSWGYYDQTATPGCTNGSSSVAITGSAQSLNNGVTVTFGHVSGYTAGGMLFFTGQVGVLATTISAYVSPHVVTLAAPATATVSSAVGTYGTDNSTAIAAALAAMPSSGGSLLFPSGLFLTSTQTRVSKPFVSLEGLTPNAGIVYAGAGAVDAAVKFAPSGTPDTSCTIATGCLFQNAINNLSIRGNANAANALLLYSTHHASFTNVKLYDAVSCFTSQFAVTNNYRNVECSGNARAADPTRAFHWMPVDGLILDSYSTAAGLSIAGTWTGTIVEHVGVTCIKLKNAWWNVFVGGTGEGCGIGLSTEVAPNGSRPGSDGNTFDTVDFEADNLLVYDQGVRTQFRNVIAKPDINTYGAINMTANNKNINGTTTGGVSFPLIGTYTDNNVYIGSTVQGGDTVIRFGTGKSVVIGSLPTSCAGKATGTLWNNSGAIGICP